MKNREKKFHKEKDCSLQRRMWRNTNGNASRQNISRKQLSGQVLSQIHLCTFYQVLYIFYQFHNILLKHW